MPITTLLLVGACVGDDPSVTVIGDAGGGEAGAVDAAPGVDAVAVEDAAPPPDAAPPRCDPKKAFGAPVLVSGLSTSADESTARLTADELTVYFARGAAGTGLPDLYMATRPSSQAGWGAAVPVPGVNTGGPDFAPMLTDDGLTLFFTSDSAGTRGGTDIFTSTRTKVSDTFPAGMTLAPLGVVNTAASEADPYVVPSGKAIWFDAYVGPGDSDIYRSASGPTGLTTREKVLGIGSAAVDAYPVVTPDELTLYFASNRVDPDSLGDYEIYVATRAVATAAFDQPKLLKVLSTADAEFPTWISRDECELYLTRRVSGNYDIYRAERPQ